MRKIISVLFWSVISAAFIGPGTVTTAASAGAQFGLQLLWALLFSTVACVVLQEASARLTVVSGRNLGQTIIWRFRGVAKTLSAWLVMVAIWLGCAAYEAGNILGGAAGARLATGVDPRILALIIGIAAGLLLFFGTTRIVATVLGGIVAAMGLAFLVTAAMVKPPVDELLKGLFIPAMPDGAGVLVIGLIGTTVVPYNLFLGSGIAAGQDLKEFRFGLVVAILLGGIISMAVLVVGFSVIGKFSFQAISDALSVQLGGWAGPFFAFGLFAAGFSSAITAPLASAITAQSLFGENWQEKSWSYRAVWMSILFVGLIFGLSGIQPIPAIILAQALNGILLPVVAIFLFLMINDKALLGQHKNPLWLNVLTGIVVLITLALGVNNVVKALRHVL